MKDIKLLNDISENKYFLGIVMILINIGARFIIEELSPNQREYINSKVFRRIIIFCAFFVATRDLLASITLTIIFILFISDLFTNENDDEQIYEDNINDIDDIKDDLNNLTKKINNLY
jgi:putative Mn2+ efflux pump MntP